MMYPTIVGGSTYCKVELCKKPYKYPISFKGITSKSFMIFI